MFSALDYNLASEGVIRDGRWHDCVGTDEPSTTNPAAMSVGKTTKNGTSGGTITTWQYQYYPNDCLWNFGWTSTWALRLYLSTNFFSGGKLEMSQRRTVDGAVGSPWLLNMFSNGTANLETLNIYIDGLASSITSVMRQNGDSPPGAYAAGTAFSSQTCIRVQWAWLILPFLQH